MSKFQLTSQQSDFIDALVGTTDNIALVARAGCGKTSTILEGVDVYAKKFPQHEITICAFGKAIQREIESKLKSRGHNDWKRIQASTTHSMGFSLLKFVFKPQIDNAKVRNIVRANAKYDPRAQMFEQFEAQIIELVHLAKTEGFGFFEDVQVGDTKSWYNLAEHYSVNGLDNTDTMDKVVAAAQQVYRQSLDQTNIIDFDDMILFPLVKNLRVKFQRDLIFVDEAQDTSRARRALVRKFVKKTGRLVVVGDDRQAIMGFAGASADALGELQRDLRARVMPLNVTWRCPKAVVREAQIIVPDIIAADHAPEGEVLSVDEMPAELFQTDAILCRNTAPLVKEAYGLIKRGVACKVEGRDIGVGLLKLVDRWKVTTIAAFRDRLEAFRDREIQKAIAKGKDSRVQEIDDKCDTLVVIADEAQRRGRQDLDAMREFINDMFSDDVRDVLTLCTYHRSKGREWKRVMLFEHAKRCPSKWAKQAWELQQESNLAYVAITRAQNTLMYVN
jgi:DNA helicase-2/ATP-dependent DNA helicase PcrA